MTYGQNTATSETEVANLMAQYVEDTFRPLSESDFDYSIFDKIQQEWENTQDALTTPLHPQLPTICTLITTTLTLTLQQPSPFSETMLTEDAHNTTKHQRAMWGLPNFNLYKHRKKPHPSAPYHNLQWMNTGQKICYTIPHNLKIFSGRYISLLTSKNWKKSLNKWKGKPQDIIDCFQELGIGGKHKLLDIANKIYASGNFPVTWKQVIMVPILKKDKAAKDLVSYRPPCM